MKQNKISRRQFMQKSAFTGLGLVTASHLSPFMETARYSMQLGLVTYQWGKDWDLPTLIANCEKTGFLGVELRTEHAHKVEINLTAAQRAEVKKRFANSPVTCLGYGSNYEFHSPDPAKLRENIEGAKAYVKLCKDIGATGLKVKPNNLPPEVPKEKTIAQIAASLNEVGKFARDYGQVIRVEAHGRGTSELPVMKAIFDQVTAKNVNICWNSNPVDLNPPGLEGNFNMVRKWIGDIVHTREFYPGPYPFQELFNLLAGNKFKGWILIEASSEPADKIATMKEQVTLFNQMVANIKK